MSPARSAGTNGVNSSATISSRRSSRRSRNIVAVLKEAGGGPEHVVRMTWYLTDKPEYVARQREIGEAYRRVMGKNFPAMSAFVVMALIEDRAKVEIEATAVIPPG